MNHPAIMGEHILSVCKQYLPDPPANILDPFAGIGTTAHLLPEYNVIGIEIEKEWADQHASTICGDSLLVIPTLNSFDAILTSPTYGNRMADDFNASDSSKRITYRHKLGHPLAEGTTSNLHFGKSLQKYEMLHRSIWEVCIKALNPNGIFILNIKDFIANKQIMNVSQWHVDCLIDLGMSLISSSQVESKGMRYGANRELRIDYENVYCFKK